jgi:hypothetical protein
MSAAQGSLGLVAMMEVKDKALGGLVTHLTPISLLPGIRFGDSTTDFSLYEGPLPWLPPIPLTL